MMAYLEGQVLHRGHGYVIVAREGVGYKVTLPEQAVYDVGANVMLFLHEAVRDDGHELFGFVNVEQLELFWKLVAVSGVGPKSGQKIVYSGSVEHVKGRIMAGDVAALTQVPGIGKKTAQKIILELKGVLAEEPVGAVDDDAVEALVGLGYARRDALSALNGLEAEDTEARIRIALKLLSR